MVQIRERIIGPGQPIFIAVEAGSTCNGDLGTALAMADAAKECGADAIKWQMIGPDDLMSDKTVQYTYEWAGGTKTENMYEMFQALTFVPKEWQEVVAHCDRIKLPWYTSVDYIAGVDLAEQLGCPMYKLSAWDCRNFPLIQRMAQTGKPIQIDLGPHVEGEIVTMLNHIPHRDVVLVHATHAKVDAEFNMLAIPYLRDKFKLPVGWSAESRERTPDFLAVGLGVCLIEKRISMKTTHAGHHHSKSLEPHEFWAWVDMIRAAERMMGVYDVRPSLEDLRQKSLWFTSIVASREIKKGEIIAKEMLCAKRPGHGISPLYMDRFVGKMAANDIAKDEVFEWHRVL